MDESDTRVFDSTALFRLETNLIRHPPPEGSIVVTQRTEKELVWSYSWHREWFCRHRGDTSGTTVVLEPKLHCGETGLFKYCTRMQSMPCASTRFSTSNPSRFLTIWSFSMDSSPSARRGGTPPSGNIQTDQFISAKSRPWCSWEKEGKVCVRVCKERGGDDGAGRGLLLLLCYNGCSYEYIMIITVILLPSRVLFFVRFRDKK